MASVELKRRVEKIKKLSRSLGGAQHELGSHLWVVYDRQLYMEVSGSWREFTEKEIGMSAIHANNIMYCAQLFERRLFEEIGITKLALVLRVHAKNHTAAIEMATRMSRTELAAELRKRGFLLPLQTNRTANYKGKRNVKVAKPEADLKKENRRLKDEVARLQKRCRDLEKTIAPTLKEMVVRLAS